MIFIRFQKILNTTYMYICIPIALIITVLLKILPMKTNVLSCYGSYIPGVVSTESGTLPSKAFVSLTSTTCSSWVFTFFWMSSKVLIKDLFNLHLKLPGFYKILKIFHISNIPNQYTRWSVLLKFYFECSLNNINNN